MTPTTRMHRANAARPGLGPDWRAVWEVAHYTLDEDRQRGPSSIVTQVEAHPLKSNITLTHSVFVHLTQDPDLPEPDMLDAQTRLLGYAAGEPGEDGKTPLVHGVRCTNCGSDQVAYCGRAWANCQACGTGQTHSEAMLCSQHCEQCGAAGVIK
ncbi:hypothetical protein [Streptomyces sp. NPDC058672]|uniref:hypothetical protein n=1 Tax=Streptomyces sp. NPDC058672 TaxID=3346591 RepID=UPI003649A29A